MPRRPNKTASSVLSQTVEQVGTLSQQAQAQGLEALAYVLDMARLEAESALVLKQSKY